MVAPSLMNKLKETVDALLVAYNETFEPVSFPLGYPFVYNVEQILSHGLKDVGFFSATTLFDYLVNLTNSQPGTDRFISRIKRAQQNDIARGRLWITTSLNETATHEYLSSLLWNTTVINKYYGPNSFLQSQALREEFLEEIARVSKVSFTLKYPNLEAICNPKFWTTIDLSIDKKILNKPTLAPDPPTSTSGGEIPKLLPTKKKPVIQILDDEGTPTANVPIKRKAHPNFRDTPSTPSTPTPPSVQTPSALDTRTPSDARLETRSPDSLINESTKSVSPIIQPTSPEPKASETLSILKNEKRVDSTQSWTPTNPFVEEPVAQAPTNPFEETQTNPFIETPTNPFIEAPVETPTNPLVSFSPSTPEPKKLQLLNDSHDSDWGNADSPILMPSALTNQKINPLKQQEMNSCPNPFFIREIEPSSVSSPFSYQDPDFTSRDNKTAAQPIRRQKKKKEQQQVSSQAMSWAHLANMLPSNPTSVSPVVAPDLFRSSDVQSKGASSQLSDDDKNFVLSHIIVDDYETSFTVSSVDPVAAFPLFTVCESGSDQADEIFERYEQSKPSGLELNLDIQRHRPPPPPEPLCFLCGENLEPRLFGTKWNFFCYYTGNYYCSGCHAPNKIEIPSRIVVDWDFTPRDVCLEAFDIIQKKFKSPFLKKENLNPTLTTPVALLTKTSELRKKASEFVVFIRTCKEARSLLLKNFADRIHLLDSTDDYSIQDLIEINQKKLDKELISFMNESIQHIASCDSCQGKGHFCEICNSNVLIFSFQHEKVSDLKLSSHQFQVTSCPKCSALFHLACMKGREEESCPRCKRIALFQAKKKPL